MYRRYIKRALDVVFSVLSLIVLSPVLLVLTVMGAISMKGNPFFVQERPGKDEKIFKLIKFRSMTCEKDENGELLPDDKRLKPYGKILRSLSLDELPEVINILKGDMSFVGPRPLLVKYLPLYNERQKRRHKVRPGLSGLAQINGRNAISWEEKFEFDITYIENITFFGDMKFIFLTILKVFRRAGINQGERLTMSEFEGNIAIENETEEIFA